MREKESGINDEDLEGITRGGTVREAEEKMPRTEIKQERRKRIINTLHRKLYVCIYIYIHIYIMCMYNIIYDKSFLYEKDDFATDFKI